MLLPCGEACFYPLIGPSPSADKYGNADYSNGMNEEGGARDTVYKLRRRSRKRRSFLDSEYTSRVSFPQPDPEMQADATSGGAQMLSLDPEPSEQTENPSPTVSSLTHSEGEPAQLESKPILSRQRLRGFAPPSAPGVHGQAREPQLTCQTRKQEMEMEPDSMESKSVTATMKAAAPSITVVRCRVDPDGKECSDRRGDGKEEVEGLEDTGDENGGGEKQELGLFLFLPNTSVEKECDEVEKNGFIRTFTGAERPPEALTPPLSLTDTDKQGQNSLLGAQVEISAQRSTSQSSPPPPSPSSPLPPGPPVSPGPPVLEKVGPDQMCFSNSTETPVCQEVPSFDQGNESVPVLSPTRTSSDEITDSNNSDSVFEDDEGSSSFASNPCGKKIDWSAAMLRSAGSSAQTRGRQFKRDYDRAISSITAKLGAATNATSPAFYSGTKVKSESTSESVAGENVEQLRPADSLTALTPPGSLTRAADDADPPSPTRFLFQACSPSLMGRLSAATLRGKIQQLPQYLSRSQESLNQPGGDPSPAAEPVGITVTGVDDVTQTVDLEMDTSAEAGDSDDSDTTVTGSEVDGEYFMDTTSANPPVQTEPKGPILHPFAAAGSNTPGPVTQPPASIVNSFHRDSSGAKMDTPGPVKTFPSSPVVVTTQNINGPRLTFHGQSQAVWRSSSERPLMGLCSLAGQKADPAKVPSPDCRVFTICEAASQSPAEVEPAPFLKSEPGCNSLLASGCESLVEGMQVPLDACGCPPAYTNCFGSTDSFDEELTVFEFSCRSQNSSMSQTCGGAPLMTSPPIPSFISTSSSIPPFFPRSSLFSSSASELSPLLSPLSDASTSTPPLPHTHKDTISRLAQQRYPEPPAGFQVLRLDVDKLLSILESSGPERCGAGRHPREICPAHFTENKRVLQVEARRLMSGCQKVVGAEQSPEDTLRSLAESFRTLVDLAGVCLCFSGCDRCERRNAEAVAGLADVARSFRDFCLAAERVSSKRSCQDLSMKLLAKQRTALTASVFCLTQLFRTLTAL